MDLSCGPGDQSALLNLNPHPAMIYALAILFPPLALLLKGRFLHAIISIPLTALFWVPGIVHACVVIARMEREWRDERLACMIRGVPPPPRPGSLPSWMTALVVAGTLAFFVVLTGLTARIWTSAPSSKPDLTTAAVPAASALPAKVAEPATPTKPQPGALFAEVVASFGEPNLAQKETGWAYWNGFKGRFQDGRLVEVVDAAETAAK